MVASLRSLEREKGGGRRRCREAEDEDRGVGAFRPGVGSLVGETSLADGGH